MDLKPQVRTQQFAVEFIRASPQLPVAQAVSAALQVADSLDLHRYQDFGSLISLANSLQLRPALEWDLFGYAPIDGAVPVRLEVPQETDPERGIRFEDHYLSFHVRRVHPPGVHLLDYRAAVGGWRKRLGYVTRPSLDYAEFAERAASRRLPMRRVEMLGNLWKIGAVATWETEREGRTSWCHVDQRPLPGEAPHSQMTEGEAWYRLGIHPAIGRDVIVEIARCLAEIYLGYVEKLWEAPAESGTQCGPESEAAAYLALERLWIPQRSRRTDWYRRYVAGESMSAEFRWDAVYRAAQQMEDLLRGDTASVTAYTGSL